MEFGKVEPKELSKIDLSLPPEPKANKAVLEKNKAKSKTRIFIGCAKWGRKDWLGKIYPKKTKEADFLDHYAQRFNSIELNATFYQIWEQNTIKKWRDKTGDDFIFCPKFYQAITHRRRLKNADDVTDLFLRSVHDFGKKLGPCFLQLPDSFG